MNTLIKQIAVFFTLLLFQVLVLNNVNIGGYINPYVYPLFILLLPFDVKGWVMLLLAFFLGFFVDVFNATPGLHSFSLVLMAAIRPTVISLISQKAQDEGKYPGLKHKDFSWMLIYMGICVFIHHFFYFIIESWSWNLLGQTFLRFLASAFMSVFIMVILLFAFKSSNKK